MGDEALSVTGVYGGLLRGMARWCAQLTAADIN
jgi:hypothetical protein